MDPTKAGKNGNDKATKKKAAKVAKEKEAEATALEEEEDLDALELEKVKASMVRLPPFASGDRGLVAPADPHGLGCSTACHRSNGPSI